MPTATRIADRLRERGIDLSENIILMSELEKALAEKLEDRNV